MSRFFVLILAFILLACSAAEGKENETVNEDSSEVEDLMFNKLSSWGFDGSVSTELSNGVLVVDVSLTHDQKNNYDKATFDVASTALAYYLDDLGNELNGIRLSFKFNQTDSIIVYDMNSESIKSTKNLFKNTPSYLLNLDYALSNFSFEEMKFMSLILQEFVNEPTKSFETLHFWSFMFSYADYLDNCNLEEQAKASYFVLLISAIEYYANQDSSSFGEMSSNMDFYLSEFGIKEEIKDMKFEDINAVLSDQFCK